MPDHALYSFVICSDLSHSFSDSTGFLLWPPRPRKHKRSFPAVRHCHCSHQHSWSCFFPFSFVVPLPDLSSHAIRQAMYLTSVCLYLPFSPHILMNSQDRNQQKNNWLTTGPQIRMEMSPSRQVRLAIPFLFWAGIYFWSSPSVHDSPQLTLSLLLFLNNRCTRRQR